MIYKFAKWDIKPLETFEASFPFKTHAKLENGGELTREEKNHLFEALSTSSYSRQGVPLGGWMFDFSQWLKMYFVQDKYGGIVQYYAPDKTAIRVRASWLGGIRRIVEVGV